MTCSMAGNLYSSKHNFIEVGPWNVSCPLEIFQTLFLYTRDGDQISEDPLENVKVSIDESRLIHVTDERYLSVAWTIGDLRKHWHNVNLR